MNTAIFLTTRYDSTRLPGKALLQVSGQTATDILIGRLKHCNLPIVMCTPDTINDEIHMKTIARKHGIGYFAGDKNNIIKRHYDAAKENNIDYIINVDGDDILTVPDVINDVYEGVLKYGCVMDVFNTIGLPMGLNILAYRAKILKKITATDTNWGAAIKRNSKRWGKCYYDIKDARLTLDYPEDWVVIADILTNCPDNMTVKGISDYLDKHPEIANYNKCRVEEYAKRLEELS